MQKYVIVQELKRRNLQYLFYLCIYTFWTTCGFFSKPNENVRVLSEIVM